MTNREIMQALLEGEQPATTPQWIMAISSIELTQRIIPAELIYEGYLLDLDGGEYGFGPMGEERLRQEQRFNKHIDRCAFPVGWGANAAFGHYGPGEFNPRVIERRDNGFIQQYETGARREVRLHPHNVHMFDMPVSGPEDLKRLQLPDPADPARYAGLAEDIAWAKANGEWTIAFINGFFSSLHYFFRDYANFFLDLAADPEFAKEMIALSGEWTLTAAQKICEAGVDCIGFCDDLGSERSMLISPAMYREMFWPWHRRLCDLVHQHGAIVHMHSHGAILPVVDLLAEAGVDILNPLDPDDEMPMEQVREAAGSRMVLCGGMDKHFWDEDWDTDRKADHLRQVVADGRRLEPHILMDSAGLPSNVTREAFDEFLVMSREIRQA